LPYKRELPCNVEYKGRPLSRDYHVDFLCFDEIVLEIKARSVTGPADHAQVINYLTSTKKRCGLLLNFGSSKLEHKRFIWEPRTRV
jgi:GxxExxY protein